MNECADVKDDATVVPGAFCAGAAVRRGNCTGRAVTPAKSPHVGASSLQTIISAFSLHCA